MKNTLMLLVLALFMATLTTSCKEHKHDKEQATEEHHAADKADMAMNEVFQCPMDCEEGKTYEEAGSCPVCKMDLKKVEKDEHSESHDHDNDDGHEH